MVHGEKSHMRKTLFTTTEGRSLRDQDQLVVTAKLAGEVGSDHKQRMALPFRCILFSMQ